MDWPSKWTQGGAKENLALLALFLVALSSCQSSAAGTGAAFPVADLHRQAERTVANLCKGLQSVRHISRVQELIENLKLLADSKQLKATDDNRNQQTAPPSSNWASDALGKFTSSPAQACVAQASAILDLEVILAEKQNVCSSEHLDRIEAYEGKHLARDLAKSSSFWPLPSTSKITKHFFRLYTDQVSVTCRKSLLRSLQEAEKLFDGERDYEPVLGWIPASGGSCKRVSAIELSEDSTEPAADKQDESGGSLDEQSSQQLSCDAAVALTSITDVRELADAMKGDSQARPNSRTSKIILLIPEKMQGSMTQLIGACKRLERVYKHTVVPIVRLIQLNHDPVYEEFETACRREELMQRWFTITLVCNSILSSRMADNTVASQLSVIDQPRMLVVAGEEFSDEVQDRQEPPSFLSNSLVDDELWVIKYQPSRLSKIGSDFTKKLMKTLKLDEIRKNVVFVNRVKYGKDVLVKLALIGLAVVTMNSFK